ncbi:MULTISPECIES: penicillin-binding protein 1C [unclassified Polaromonas]|jgi:penicillin-binding protein 1C|uniref:penicillin-binding protein 1C n=1 Tax=unclassified Polaromonas TaxID=2638319 RepID=UPI000BCAAA23|nr:MULTISPECIES: penicillin-binding protein 1C [unclassified Polaromonas]OYY36509.1 MAG: penicillin-binding protein 1C [Polaromonas sp. 35-63-35]OYZ22744.1 MAG: penicillin-binding protein 1C [Polaromonas sp. 16-63-31]OYZ81043.1 MAG: penicillin-binding protein 1C [Polaromonas sp. 24-63-21]OZA52738.1 MAG: penicillin-binding protein 1C [Polaromonas sp. 17-63-33]OZA88407.1 MAG: penicillin-binding protein 1C [Polaromonas sp. 39-63-25]
MNASAIRAAAVAIFLIATCARPAWATATFNEVKREFKPSDTLILDRNGEVIQRLRTDATVRRGQWVALPDISPALRTALVLSEDKRFYEHSGVDWRAVSAAAWGNLWATRTRGASTLSMQLAGLLDEDWRAAAGGRSVAQKIGQTVSAQLLERSWRKDQILEAYLNLVPFRGEIVGIDALSRTLFGKAAHGLDEREAALAAALVRAPNAKAVQVSQRACGVLKAMQAPAKTDCEGLDLFASAALQRKSFDPSEGVAPHLARRLLSTTVRPEPVEGFAASKASTSSARTVMRSTLRAPLQRFAVATLTQHLRELRGRHVEDGAIVVLDNASGEVLAWVGSSGELSDAAEVDGVLALRQPGSTLKPFLYAQAIAERRITAASLLEDSSSQIPTAGGLYIPQNYDRQFKGLVSSRTALGASLNVPAVRTLVMVSPDAFHKQLRAVGLPLRETGDYYGYSLALGSSEVSLLSLTNAYRTLANGGRYSALSLTRNTRLASTPAIDARASFIVSDILSDPLARARTFGTDSLLATRFWTAVKTGTSKDMRDNWALGYSQRYTVGVWVGNASGAPMWDVSGTSGAAPVWAALMNYLHQTEPSRAPVPPAGVLQKPVSFADAAGTPIEAARSEWFLRGTEQTLFTIDSGAAGADRTRAGGQKGLKNPGSASSVAARITAPANGTIVALDPDIPPKRQRLGFAAEGHQLRWRMDGKEFARGAQAQWLPWPGRHVVQLVSERGEVLDEIRIEVRGAGVKAGRS